ncbi:hypothetical protein HYPBUDRAFT_8283 [Hyphopichia burtonii NRRL Y-1933]|uniref:Uncharacterized protein n=1 Tax=Hyphopichia burtonii NRRL Y-1933 TaxID=984485 RepID=A0A1E4RC38_9ASCO|nr:hypothetical protein HYPBUDRAFT_8283 [Hyphopichia burtonii NRRL Y-1933]ODV64811.1 hypothetical protein HYPBUDRAFT_8283 [Hyphopichia burtonii NRRL Y-1933]
MFRHRKSRSGQNISYTGVNHVAPSSSQPNSNALAAALTIGHSIKPEKQNTNISRSKSLQYIRNNPPPIRSNNNHTNNGSSGSLLKRNPSLTSSPNSARLSQPVKYRQHTPDSANSSHIYDIDDTFDDSHYDTFSQGSFDNNYVKMQDLKLSHPVPTGSNHTFSLSKKPLQNSNTSVKTVKKYIPTPNGIKIIEVPEVTLQKEIDRHNSIRSGVNIPTRTNSLNKNKISRSTSLLKNKSPVQNKTSRPSSRLSSLDQSFIIQEDPEPNNFNDYDQKMRELEAQINHEKQLAKDYESKRLEYEELRLNRLKNEKNLLELMKAAEKSPQKESIPEETDQEIEKAVKEEDDVEVPIASVPKGVDELDQKHPVQQATINVPINKPELETVDTSSLNNAETTVGDISTIQEEETKKSPLTKNAEDESVPDAAIDPSAVVVDEFEKEQIRRNSAVEEESGLTSTQPTTADEKLTNGFVDNKHPNQVSGSNTEIGIINRYGHMESNELISQKPFKSDVTSSDYSEESADELASKSSSSIAKQLRPKFDNVPEIIDDSHSNASNRLIDEKQSSDTLQLPASITENGLSSGSSISSVDSSSQSKNKRPVKSAMKNSSSFYSSTSNSSNNGTYNPAKQAYISLTTAENTRLNSKLSSSQLADINLAKGSQQYPSTSPNRRSVQATPTKQNNQPQSPQNQTPQTPVVAGNGNMSGRSLRPHSVHGANFDHDNHQNRQSGLGGGSMSNRTLRDRSSVYVQPIAAHPASNPNYQSPSKTKAAELYAKANARPISVFNPQLTRKSSFDKGNDTNQENPKSPKQNRHSHHYPAPQQPRQHRTTLRDSVPAHNPQSQYQTQTHAQPSTQLPAQNQAQVQAQAQLHAQAQFLAQAQFQAQTPPAPQQQRAHLKQLPQQKFQSRIADSDDEADHSRGDSGKGFVSRFADSDNEADDSHPVSTQAQDSPSNHITTLRQQDGPENNFGSKTGKNIDAAEFKSSQKKPRKKKFLKKIFGRD